MRSFIHSALVVLICLSIASEKCREPIPEVLSPRHVRAIMDSVILYDRDLYSPASVRAFYERRHFTTAWHGENTPQRDSMIKTIAKAREHGLIPEEYHFNKLDSILKITRLSKIPYVDILLTDAFIKLSRHLGHGRTTPTLGPDNAMLTVDTTILRVLEEGLSRNRIAGELSRFEPSIPDYRDLQKVLSAKLSIYEDMLLSAEEKLLLSADIMKIIINLERWRRENPFEERYLLVNIPSYELKVVEHDSIILTSRIIVGLPANPTPVLSSEIECIILYPYWNVPASIARKELLPIIQADSSYLFVHHFDVLNSDGGIIDPSEINWRRYNKSNFPFRLRQREGPDNALGLIKFQFENSYGVFLHDTNARNLFQKKERALSHGCVRVENSFDLAVYLLQSNNRKISRQELQQSLDLKRKKEIPIKNPLPVYIRYFTANHENIFPDIYAKDGPLLSAFKDFLPQGVNTLYDEPENQATLATLP